MKKKAYSLILTSLLFPISCTTPQASDGPTAEAPSAPPVEPVTLAFAWPVPSRASVVEEVEKGDTRATLHYTMDVSRRDDGNLRVSLSDMRFASINGERIDTPEEEEATRALLVQLGALPNLVVSPEGDFLGVEDIEQMVDTVVSLSGIEDAKTRAAVEASLRDPQTLAGIEQRIGDSWNAWCSIYLGQPLSPDPHKFSSPEMHFTFRLLSSTGEHLEPEVVIEWAPEAFKAALAEQMRRMMVHAGKDPAEFPPIDEAIRTATMRATLERDTARPRTAERTELNRVSIEGDTQERRESHRYTFTWKDL